MEVMEVQVKQAHATPPINDNKDPFTFIFKYEPITENYIEACLTNVLNKVKYLQMCITTLVSGMDTDTQK